MVPFLSQNLTKSFKINFQFFCNFLHKFFFKFHNFLHKFFLQFFWKISTIFYIIFCTIFSTIFYTIFCTIDLLSLINVVQSFPQSTVSRRAADDVTNTKLKILSTSLHRVLQCLVIHHPHVLLLLKRFMLLNSWLCSL